MTRYIEVTVTATDIRVGEPQAIMGCPLAWALDNFLIAPRVTNEGWYGLYRGSYRGVGGTLSKSARRFVRDFDNGRPVQPRTFRLPIVEEADDD